MNFRRIIGLKLKLNSRESGVISLVKAETPWEMQFNMCETVNGDGPERSRRTIVT